jgi:5-methylcytosine-specific restriction endonuclease McrA
MHARQLAAAPYCALCWQKGLVVPAQVADHVVPHRGDARKFWFGRLQSLCEPCHNGIKTPTERLGYSKEIGLDGWPTDPNHPAYRA